VDVPRGHSHGGVHTRFPTAPSTWSPCPRGWPQAAASPCVHQRDDRAAGWGGRRRHKHRRLVCRRRSGPCIYDSGERIVPNCFSHSEYLKPVRGPRSHWFCNTFLVPPEVALCSPGGRISKQPTSRDHPPGDGQRIECQAVTPEARRSGRPPHQQTQNGLTIGRSTGLDRKLANQNCHEANMERISFPIGERRRSCDYERMDQQTTFSIRERNERWWRH
jgi:hypothetical protein